MDTHQVNAAPCSPQLVGEELVSHTFLDYINTILMDDCYEGCTGSQLPAGPQHGLLSQSYQHIFDGFYDILCDSTPPSSGSVHPPSSASLWSHGAEYSLRTNDPGHACLLAYDGASTLDAESDSIKLMSFGMVQDMVMPNIQHTAANDQELQIINGSFVRTAETSNTNAFSAFSHVPVDNDATLTNVLRDSLKTGARKEGVSFVRNVDLEAEVYAQLFDEWPGRDKREVASAAIGALSTRQKVKGREDAALTSSVDLKALLLNSAKALGEGNTSKVMELLQQVQQQGASPHASGLRRVAHYFSEALIARMSGMGSTLYRAIASTSQLPTAMMTLKAYKFVFEVCPYLKIAHYFANQYILKAASGASRLHIVDYGIFYGFQWPCLIYALAHRREGPPFLRITGIELPLNPAGINPAATTDGTGGRLIEYARAYRVPFEYHAISASRWEEIEPSSLHILPDEVLVINSFNRLRHLHDESAVSSSPRDRLLRQMQSLSPHLLVTGFMNASHSSPFFAPRFREALHYYSNKFDTIHTIAFDDSPERVMFEREVMGRAILNVVACEGVERVERPETYKQWQGRLERAGFQQRPIIPVVLSTAQAIMKGYHKDFSLLHPSNMWMLLGWRGRTMQAISAWEPAASPHKD